MIDVLNVFRQNEYVIDSLELRVTHRKLRTDAGIIARVLLRFGIKAGDIIAVSMPNLYQAVAVFKAANKIGAVTTFLNPLSTREELIQNAVQNCRNMRFLQSTRLEMLFRCTITAKGMLKL